MTLRPLLALQPQLGAAEVIGVVRTISEEMGRRAAAPLAVDRTPTAAFPPVGSPTYCGEALCHRNIASMLDRRR